MSRHFRIELEWSNPDGTPTALQQDLKTKPQREKWLGNLSDDFLHEAEPMVGWGRGPAGSWIFGPLGDDDYVVAQFRRGELGLWRVPGAQPGLLTVLRILAKNKLVDFIGGGKP